MPLKIIRQDITKIKCDAIVNPTNRHMWPGGGADAAIHEAAGPALLDYCQSLGGVSVGEAKITPAFNLPCKYVIHTAGPEWEGGLAGERVLLRSCYKESMKLAIKHGCKTVAFPLIASGLYGYPKDRVLSEATDVISRFLERYEMDVYIVVYDKTAYSISRDLYDDVQSFVDNFYVETHSDMFDNFREEATYQEHKAKRTRRSALDKCIMAEALPDCASMCSEVEAPFQSKRLDNMLENMDKGFAETLFHYIDKKGLTDVEAYKRSNVGKKTFSKIKCNRDYKPSKITAVSFAIGLHLDLEDTKHLLSTAGMCLSRSNKFDVIIEYFIMSGKYETIFDVNEVLYQFDQSLLGV
jgi:O-acetyl-ADP-ribose deacetylase (regulator of RNase III)